MKCLQLSSKCCRATRAPLRNGRHLGATGFCRGNMFASAGSLFAFLVLQRMHEHTTFSQVVFPPLSRGTTWSMFNSFASKVVAQYWQV